MDCGRRALSCFVLTAMELILSRCHGSGSLVMGGSTVLGLVSESSVENDSEGGNREGALRNDFWSK